MLKFSSPVVLQLQEGELLAVAGVSLAVESGRVWVTRDSDPVDHLLGGGASMQIEPGARALVSAEGPARVAVSSVPLDVRSALRRGLRRLAARLAPRLPCDLDFSLAK
jgi:Protein of unknown function (DUF2917)